MDSMGDNGQVLPALSLTDIDTTINGEPRIHDLRLAEALGFSQVRDIRKLIERHREALERLGEVCATVAQTSRKGGRPATEFWLTKKQAIYITTKAETDRATDITIAVVELFDQITGGPPPGLEGIEADIVQRLRAMPPDQRERLRVMAVTGLPEPAAPPPFCVGCVAPKLWNLGGFNQTRHPLRKRSLDLVDLEILRVVREYIDAEVKGQLAAHFEKAMAQALKSLSDPDLGPPA